MNISDIMSRDVQACGPDDTLESLAMIMWNSDCGSVPVIDTEGRPLGIITDRDITMASALQHKPLWEIPTREVMNSRPVFTCNSGDDIQAAIKTICAQKVRRLPVLDNAGCLEGIVSVDDIVACAERGERGSSPELSYDDAISTLKAVCIHH